MGRVAVIGRTLSSNAPRMWAMLRSPEMKGTLSHLPQRAPLKSEDRGITVGLASGRLQNADCLHRTAASSCSIPQDRTGHGQRDIPRKSIFVLIMIPNSVWRSTLILSAWSCWLMWGTLLTTTTTDYPNNIKLTHKSQPSPSSPNGTLLSRPSATTSDPSTTARLRSRMACFD